MKWFLDAPLSQMMFRGRMLSRNAQLRHAIWPHWCPLGLNMRIGLHHGQFVAGVIGSNQLRFDIWGEDCLMSVKQRAHS